jgi:hypothetical protein
VFFFMRDCTRIGWLVGGGVGVVLFVAGESQGHGHGHGFTKTRVDERASSCSHFEANEPVRVSGV